jgi:hypothetical protein
LAEARKVYDNPGFAEWVDWAALLMPLVVDGKRNLEEEHQAGLDRQRQDAEARKAEVDRRQAELDAIFEDGQMDADEYKKRYADIEKMRDEDVVMGDVGPEEMKKPEAPKPRPKLKPILVMTYKATSPLNTSSKGTSERGEVSDDEGGSEMVQSGEERQAKRKQVGELRAVTGPVSQSMLIVPSSY